MATALSFEKAVKDVAEFKGDFKGDSNYIHAFRSYLPRQQRSNKHRKPPSAKPKAILIASVVENRTIHVTKANTKIILVTLARKMVTFLLLLEASASKERFTK